MKKKEINYQLLIRRICLIVLDIICIIAASILALLTRFEFDFSQIPKEFLKVIYKYGPFTIVITLIIFSLFRIYSSLWEYAGIEEVFSLIAACLAAAVAKIVIILFTWSVMPRSWYVLDTIYLMILIGATRVSYRLIRLRRQNRTFPWSKRKKVMIIGGGEAGRSLITEIQNSKYLDQKCEIYPARRGQNWQLLLPIYYKYKRFFLDEPLYGYVIYAQSMSQGDVTKEKVLERWEEHEKILNETLKRMNMDSKDLEKYLKMVQVRYIKKRFFTAIDYKDKKLIKQQYNLLKINEESRKELKLLYYRNEYLIIKILCKVLEKIKRRNKLICHHV